MAYSIPVAAVVPLVSGSGAVYKLAVAVAYTSAWGAARGLAAYRLALAADILASAALPVASVTDILAPAARPAAYRLAPEVPDLVAESTIGKARRS